MDPKFPRSMYFAETQQAGPEEAAGQQHQGHELHADVRVLVKPKEIKPKIPKVYSYKLNNLPTLNTTSLGSMLVIA